MAKNIFKKLKMTSTNVGKDVEQKEHAIQSWRKGKLIAPFRKLLTPKTQHTNTLCPRSPRYVSFISAYTVLAALFVIGKTKQLNCL